MEKERESHELKSCYGKCRCLFNYVFLFAELSQENHSGEDYAF